MIDENMIQQAIEVAIKYPDHFGCNILKRKLHTGTANANRILEQLQIRGLIRVEYEPTYRVVVLIKENPDS